MSLPTKGELFTELTKHLRKAQETAAMIAHIERDNHAQQAIGWLAVSEKLKEFTHKVTLFSARGLQ